MTIQNIAELVERLRYSRCLDANCVKCRAASALESQAAEIARLRGSGLSEAAKIVQELGEKNPHMDATWLSGVLDAERAIRRARAALLT